MSVVDEMMAHPLVEQSREQLKDDGDLFILVHVRKTGPGNGGAAVYQLNAPPDFERFSEELCDDLSETLGDVCAEFFDRDRPEPQPLPPLPGEPNRPTWQRSMEL